MHLYTHRYVNKYISVQDRDYRALKLLGQIYANTGHHIKAIYYYKRYIRTAMMCMKYCCIKLLKLTKEDVD